MSFDDKAVRARAAGKITTAHSVVWQLQVGHNIVRCRRVALDLYVAEMRALRGWQRLRQSSSAELLLGKLLSTPTWTEAIRVAATAAEPKP